MSVVDFIPYVGGNEFSLCVGLLGANLMLTILMIVLIVRFPALEHDADATGIWASVRLHD